MEPKNKQRVFLLTVSFIDVSESELSQSMSSSSGYDRDLPRGKGRGRGRGRGSQGLISREETYRNGGSNIIIGMNFGTDCGQRSPGRGRGMGRGVDRTMPAWMKDHRLQNVESLDMKTAEREKNSKLLTVPKKDELVNFDEDLTEINTKEVDEYEIKRQQILEQQELERVAEQFADSDNDDTVDFEAFETEHEKEERLARERRDKRKRRLKQLQSQKEDDKKQKVLDAPHQEQLTEEPNENANKESTMVDKGLVSLATDNSPPNGTTSVGNGKDSSGADSFDMFSSSVSPVMKVEEHQKNSFVEVQATVASKGVGIDDAEGYYRATIGEVISFARSREDSLPASVSAPLSFRVQGIIGKGVFSTVLKCTRIKEPTQSDGNGQVEDVIAMKLIRANETMARAAQKEARILRLIHKKKSKKNKVSTGEEAPSSIATKFIVKMLEPEDFEVCSLYKGQNKSIGVQELLQQPLLEHHNHVAILFEHLPFNLRECLSKFGKNVGISLGAVRSYTKQLLNALKHLAAHRIVHADIKLDNILVSSNFSSVKLCDFGSAFLETDSDNDPTPYLVSRFYRAPEVILGLEYDHMIDLWSVAVSMAELFTGNVLFPGRTNNDMLHKIMQTVGPASNKLIKRHITCFTRLGLAPHFEAVATGVSNFSFRQQDIDKVTGRPVIRVLDLNSTGANSIGVGKKQITQVLLKSRSTSDGRGEVIKFSTFLLRCLSLDPVKRIRLDDAFAHEFLTSNA